MYRAFAIAIVLLLGVSSGASASAPWHLLSTEPATPAPGESFLIAVDGTWPNGCPFEVSPVSREGNMLKLRLTEQPGVCTEALRPYQLRIDPAPTLARGLDAGSYQIELEAEDRSGVRTIGFGVFDVAPADRVVRPEAGFWVADPSGRYADSGSGVGFNLERQDDALAMIAYFYDHSGEPRWYFSAGDARRTGYAGDLLEIRGGQAVFQPYQAPRDMRPFGRIDLSFSDRGHAVAWFSQPQDEGILAELRVMPISLVRFGFKAGATAPALSGRWMLMELDGVDGSGRVIDLQPDVSAAPLQLRLEDQRLAVSLDCGIVTSNLDQPPALCVLATEQGQVSLEHNGIHELHSADGQTRLIRIDR